MKVNEKKLIERIKMGNWRNTKTRVGRHGRLLLLYKTDLIHFARDINIFTPEQERYLQAKHTQHTENTQKGETNMILKYKVYERLELRGIEPFNTLIGSFRYNEDVNKFLKEKQKRLTTTTQFVSLFSFSRERD